MRGLGVEDFAGRFSRDESGVTAIFFGIMFAFMFLVAAVAVDYSRATKELIDEQYALDAALLAAADHLGDDDEDVAGQAKAEKFFQANLSPGSKATISVELDGVAGTVNGVANNAMSTTLLSRRAAGNAHTDYINLRATSQIVRGNGTIEIALVVDNSGSMAGTYIEDLKAAATNLVNTVFTGADSDKVKVGLIPFSSAVNVGSIYADADWMDTEAIGPTHSENFSEAKSRFDLFADLGEAWGGCVEARPAPYDVTDAEAMSGTPATMFVPMFAPDEPDDINADNAGYDNYVNNYISDYGGTCPAAEQICLVYNKKKQKCTSYGPAPIDIAEAQSRVCKYSGAEIIDGTGPNYGCSVQPLLPLSSNKASVQAAIDSLAAGGNTNIGEGTMWGWRVLSPSEPFSEGKDYSDTNNSKVLVVMTDGANTYSATDNHNKSRYGAFGYGVKDRLGTTYTSSSYSDAMDLKLTAACTAAKAAGIKIYTVAFRLESDPATQTLLRGCATDDDHAFVASNGNALIQAFDVIGQEIAKLRIAG